MTKFRLDVAEPDVAEPGAAEALQRCSTSIVWVCHVLVSLF
jgi:hypothetical protein